VVGTIKCCWKAFSFFWNPTQESSPNEEEWSQIKSYPLNSKRLLDPLSGWLGEFSNAKSEHHDRRDGTGHPLGLHGTDISLSRWIVAVTDAFEVTTATRYYKEPMFPKEVLAELVRCSGTHFDPRVVRVSIGSLRLVA
jgi:HD-GYP domain-containing protein (c-di-GMP phosphodiesterase class II)